MKYKCTICNKEFEYEVECIECENKHLSVFSSKEAKNLLREVSALCFYEIEYNTEATIESLKLANEISTLLTKFRNLTGYR